METEAVLRARLNLETGQVAWSSLQRFFAQGKTRFVSAELDLVEVAVQIIRDNGELVEQWMGNGSLKPVPDNLAKAWIEEDAYVWSVVVRPWVLVQPIAKDTGS